MTRADIKMKANFLWSAWHGTFSFKAVSLASSPRQDFRLKLVILSRRPVHDYGRNQAPTVQTRGLSVIAASPSHAQWSAGPRSPVLSDPEPAPCKIQHEISALLKSPKKPVGKGSKKDDFLLKSLWNVSFYHFIHFCMSRSFSPIIKWLSLPWCISDNCWSCAVSNETSEIYHLVHKLNNQPIICSTNPIVHL